MTDRNNLYFGEHEIHEGDEVEKIDGQLVYIRHVDTKNKYVTILVLSSVVVALVALAVVMFLWSSHNAGQIQKSEIQNSVKKAPVEFSN